MIGHVVAYTIVDATYLQWLEGWLYWHRERYDRLFVLLLDNDEECRRLIRRYGAEEMPIIGTHGIGVQNTSNTFITDRYYHIYNHAANLGNRVWYSVIDVDEVVDPVLDVRALAHWCQRRGLVVAFAHMIDRVAADGFPRPIGLHTHIFQDFPERVCFGRDITGWDFSKPFLRRSDFWGLHRIENVKHANGLGCSHAFELCHFDFTTENHARSVHKARIVRAHYQKWFQQYDRLIAVCETGIDLEKLRLPPRDYEATVASLGGDEGRAVIGARLPDGFTSLVQADPSHAPASGAIPRAHPG